MQYNDKKHILSCLSYEKAKGNILEYFKVNIDKEDSILKKLVRIEKRKSLKRAKNFSDKKAEDIDKDEANLAEEEDLPIEKKVDKEAIRDKLSKGDYDLSVHF